MILDKSQPYGEVWGAAGHKYEQHGKRFNLNGQEVDMTGKVKPEIRRPKRKEES